MFKIFKKKDNLIQYSGDIQKDTYKLDQMILRKYKIEGLNSFEGLFGVAFIPPEAASNQESLVYPGLTQDGYM